MTLLLLGAGRSSSSFSPSSIDGLSFWLDADGSYLLTEPSARDLEATNNEYFSVAAPATDYDLGTDDFGITLSVLRETAGTKQVICGKYVDGTNYWFLWIGTDNILRFQAVASGGIIVDITGTTALSSTSAWYTLGVIIDRDSSANTKLYVNGADDTAGTPTVRTDDVTLNAAFEVGRGDFVEIGALSFNVETTTLSETFDLIHPLSSATSVSFDVDWGDGNVDTGITSKTDPLLTHTYASAGTYTINITGTLDDFAFNNGGDKTKVTSVNRVAGDTLGLSDAYHMFNGCSNLTTIGVGCFDDCAGFTLGYYQCFYNCSSLTAIPAGLFDNHGVIADNVCFTRTWMGCSSLTAIPANLFDTQTGSGTFFFEDAFKNCTGLTSIPTGLFDNCTAVTTFKNTFNGCSGLASIPSGLFNNNTAVTRFDGTFQTCSNLTSIPTGLFNNNTAVTSFASTFYGCSNLTSIPTGLFDNNTAVTKFGNTFGGCSGLTAIPTDLFRYNTAVTTFSDTFNGCSGLTAIPTDLFRYNTNLGLATSFALVRTFQGCTSLTSIPVDLFRYNTAVSTSGCISTFNGCTSLTTVPADIFLYNTACTDFANCFFNCALTQTSVDNFLVSLDSAGQSNGTADCDGGTSSAPGTPGSTAISNLQGRGWTVTTN